MNSIFIPRAFRKVTRGDVVDAFEHLFNDRFSGNIRMTSRSDRNTGEKFWIITVTINHDGNHMGIIRFFNDLSSGKPLPVYLANGHYLKCCKYNPPRSRVPPPNPPPSPTLCPTPCPTPTPSPTPSPSPSPIPTPTPTPCPTPSPTSSPTRNPTPSPTRNPTPSPTQSPTRNPTPSPTPSSDPTKNPCCPSGKFGCVMK